MRSLLPGCPEPSKACQNERKRSCINPNAQSRKKKCDRRFSGGEISKPCFDVVSLDSAWARLGRRYQVPEVGRCSGGGCRSPAAEAARRQWLYGGLGELVRGHLQWMPPPPVGANYKWPFRQSGIKLIEAMDRLKALDVDNGRKFSPLRSSSI